MNLVTDKGCFSYPLRKACIIIASCFLVTILINAIFNFNSNVVSLTGFVVFIVGNIALLFGAIKNQKWFVLVWLIAAIIFFVNWPFALLGIIFNYGGYRAASGFTNIFIAIIVHVIDLIIYLYCTRIVYSFFKELQNPQIDLRSAAIV